jgi:hypothetical protein
MKYTGLKGEIQQSEVWSPGPVANSVWLVNGSCAKWAAKSESWKEVRPPMEAGRRAEESQTYRLSCRSSPLLPEKLWRNSIHEELS